MTTPSKETTHVLLVMNCEKYAFKADAQKKTWLRDMPVPYYHVRGDPHLEEAYEFNHDAHVLMLRVRDDYNALPQKVVMAYETIAEYFPRLQYVFKTDDDQVLQPKASAFFASMIRMIDLSIQQQSPIHYGGNVVHVSQAYKSKYHTIHPELPQDLPLYPTIYCSGRFYFLSRAAVEELVKKKKVFADEYLEDYAVGRHLPDAYKSNAKPIATDALFQDMPNNVLG